MPSSWSPSTAVGAKQTRWPPFQRARSRLAEDLGLEPVASCARSRTGGACCQAPELDHLAPAPGSPSRGWHRRAMRRPQQEIGGSNRGPGRARRLCRRVGQMGGRGNRRLCHRRGCNGPSNHRAKADPAVAADMNVLEAIGARLRRCDGPRPAPGPTRCDRGGGRVLWVASPDGPRYSR